MPTTTQRRKFPEPPSAANAVLFQAHPKQDSFCHALGEAWRKGAESSGLKVTSIEVHQLEFEPRLFGAYSEDQELEPDLAMVRDAIAQASHIAFALPTWWASPPAALKGMIDRVFLPGWAFQSNGGGFPKPGLAGRSGRVLVTMDAPGWYDKLAYRGSPWRQLSSSTLKFCGVKPVRVQRFCSVGKSTLKQRQAMLDRAELAGAKDAKANLARFTSSSLPQVA